MIDEKIKLPKEQFLISDMNRFNYNSNREGILYDKAELGQYLHKGDLIVTIYDPINKQTENVYSEHCGFVFSIKMQDKVDKGENIASVLQKQACEDHGTKEHDGFVKIVND